MKQQLLRIEQVKVDKELYPRANVDFVTCARYLNALKSGEQFPPITVAKLGEEYNLRIGKPHHMRVLLKQQRRSKIHS